MRLRFRASFFVFPARTSKAISDRYRTSPQAVLTIGCFPPHICLLPSAFCFLLSAH